MNILAVDTAGKTAGVALLQDDRLLYEVYLDAGMTHRCRNRSINHIVRHHIGFLIL